MLTSGIIWFLLVVICPISINFTTGIKVSEPEYLISGLTKLRNEIYVLCESFSPRLPHVIRVFEDRHPFSLQKQISIKEIKRPFDIASNVTENLLYISDNSQQCVWKITIEA